jgi:hypothetical protein
MIKNGVSVKDTRCVLYIRPKVCTHVQCEGTEIHYNTAITTFGLFVMFLLLHLHLPSSSSSHFTHVFTAHQAVRWGVLRQKRAMH